MGIAITLRDQVGVNHFRDLLIGSIRSGAGTSALLCSGFFQEGFRSSYLASKETHFSKELANSKVALTTVGVHNYGWFRAYKSFRNNMLAAGVNISCFRSPGMRWHAKVFILSSNDQPVFGIIGSSNITRPAFSTTNPFNRECDVFLWSDSNNAISDWMENRMDELNDYRGVIRAPYLPEMNGGLGVEDRLSRLQDQVIGGGLSELEE